MDTNKGKYGLDRNRDLGQQGSSNAQTYGIREMTKADRSLVEVLDTKGKSVHDISDFKPDSYYKKLRDKRQKDIIYVKEVINTVTELRSKERAEERLDKLSQMASEIREIKARASEQHKNLDLFGQSDKNAINELNNALKKLKEDISSDKYKPRRYTEQSFKSEIQSIFET